MKIEFREEDDLKQACYEATLDMIRYIAHLEGIAARCREHFPEVAAGLHGTADGLKQYLRGVDGGWRTPGNEHLRTVLSGADFEEHLWAYEFCRDARAAVLLMGVLAAVSVVKPRLSFWEALSEAHAKLADLDPLVEKLLASSPRRIQ